MQPDKDLGLQPSKVTLRRTEQLLYSDCNTNRHSFILEDSKGLSAASVARLYNPRSKKHVATTSLVAGGVYPRCGVPAKVMGCDWDRDTIIGHRRSMDLSDLEKLRLESGTYLHEHDTRYYWKNFGKAMVFLQFGMYQLFISVTVTISRDLQSDL